MSFSLQVGEAEPQEEVLMMCDDPTNQHFFKVKNYIELLELKERLLASLCDGKDKIIGSAHEILVLTAYAQKPPWNAHFDVFSGARGLNFGLSFYLHTRFVYASNGGSDEYAHMCRLALAFAAR